MLQRVIFIIILVVVNDWAFAETDSSDKDPGYMVQPGDFLGVSVWKEADLQLEIVIRPDGAFTMPLVGKVDTRGKTIEGIRTEISSRLQSFIPDAEVTVFAKKLLGNRVFVIGKVSRPGEIVLNSNIDVVQALSKAGGTTAFAEVDEIKILRRIKGVQKIFSFNYSKIEEGKGLEQNMILESGDIVVVP